MKKPLTVNVWPLTEFHWPIVTHLMEGEKLAVELGVLQHLSTNETINDTWEYAQNLKLNHELVVGVVKSLHVDAFVSTEDLSTSFYVLSTEAEEFLQFGSPECRMIEAMEMDQPITKAELTQQLGPKIIQVAYGVCMKNKWIALNKAEGTLSRKVEEIEDVVQQQLQKVQASQGNVQSISETEVKALKRRKLISLQVRRSLKVLKGAQFAPQRKRQVAGITKEMLESGAWKTETFKPYNYNSLGFPVGGGHLHPLMKVRTEFRQVLMDMGFQEMPTNRFVESSFWNFDALFQPQSHPARDAHDTFFLKQPESCNTVPEEYYERVRNMHEFGGHGSIGHGQGTFTRAEAKKNLLRTHTTAISAQMLYKLANQEGGFRPQKYFSIDRVFRNESMDATHLAEFHQVEGVIADYDLSLGDLIGVISEFFHKIGLKDVRFKPAFNPYTEPSMEIFGFHPDLNKWTEIGNSGVFRPEMLLPMGLPENVRVIAWGLSLERPTMIKYRLDNIRDLFGHKVDLEQTKSAKLYRM